MTRIRGGSLGCALRARSLQFKLHADMAGDKAEPLVKTMRVDARLIGSKLNQPAASDAGDIDRVTDEALADAANRRW